MDIDGEKGRMRREATRLSYFSRYIINVAITKFVTLKRKKGRPVRDGQCLCFLDELNCLLLQS